MKKSKLLAALALSLSLTLTSCSDDEKTSQNSATEKTTVAAPITKQVETSDLLSYIPAQTPVLFSYVHDGKHPLPQNFKNKMDDMYAALGEMIDTIYLDAIKKSAPADKAKEIDEFANKWLNAKGLEKMGFNIDEFEMAFYAVDLFPVLRLNLAKNNDMQAFVDELMAKANESKPDTATKNQDGKRTIYQFGDKEAKILVSLEGQKMVVSFSPTREVDKLMPKLLGFTKPSKSLTQGSQYKQTLAKYNYIPTGLYWIDMRQLADYFVNPNNHPTPMLDLLQVEDGKLSADCKTEILQMFDKMPRLVGGTTLFDEHVMDSHLILELTGGLGDKLSGMTGRIPSSPGAHELTYGFSFDIVGAKKIAMDFVNSVEASPYKCEFFSGINEKVATIKAKINQPLPPFVSNFKGVNIVINEVQLDMSQTEPKDIVKKLDAQLLLAVDSPQSLLGMAQSMMPELQKMGLEVGGKAVNVSKLIPVSGKQIPINLDNVFMAIGQETIGISLGLGSDKALTQTVASQSDKSIFNFDASATMFKNIYASMATFTGKYMSAEEKATMEKQNAISQKMLWWTRQVGDLTFTDRGLEINANIEY